MTGVLEVLKSRGLVDGTTSDDLGDYLSNPRRFYIGYDPTADSLHIGSLMGIIVARWFQMHGHTPVLLLGGATGRIGDPSGKDKERPLLDETQIDNNVSAIGKLLGRFLNSDPDLAPIVVNNLDWLGKFSLIDFLRDVGKQFRMGTMLSKESVKRRLESDEGMSFTEFTYQMMQGYDFFHLYKELGVTLELGGSDQWGNIVAGVEFTRRLSGESVHGMTFPLLTRSDGKKFGKSESGAIWLTEEKTSVYDFYQYFYRIPDQDVIKMMRFLTFLSMDEITEIERSMAKSDYRPNSAQQKLAEEVTRFVHGEDGVKLAQQITAQARPGSAIELNAETLKKLSSEFPTASLEVGAVLGKKYVDLCVEIGLLSSKGEANRLIKNSGAYLNNEKVAESGKTIGQDDLVGGQFLVFGAGKKKKMLLEIKKP